METKAPILEIGNPSALPLITTTAYIVIISAWEFWSGRLLFQHQGGLAPIFDTTSEPVGENMPFFGVTGRTRMAFEV